MAFDPEKHHRSSIRLKDYDYSQPGAYFVTICTQNRECVLGRIENEKYLLSESGKIIQHVISRLPDKFPDVGLDEFVIMPNHVHAIIFLGINEGSPRVGARFIAPKNHSNRKLRLICRH
jgi:putative transposase